MKDNAVTHLDAGEAAEEIESRKNASDLSEKIKARYGENKRIVDWERTYPLTKYFIF